MSEYRDGLKRASKEVPYTAWTFLKWGLLFIVILAILTFTAQALGIISLDINREVIQHSRQYVETKVNLLNKLHSDWLQLNTEVAELKSTEGNEDIINAKVAQQKNIVKRIKTEAEMIPKSEVPNSVEKFISTH